jgi:hypothetical protein
MKHASDASRPLGTVPVQTLPERIEALKPFADCINQHLQLGLIQAWDVEGFKALSEEARRRIGSPDDPYYTAFSRGVLELAAYAPETDKISLICDEDKETSPTSIAHYNAVREVEDAVKRKVVSLTFGDDGNFPALQAADLVAYLSRREAANRFFGTTNHFQPLFDYMVSAKPSASMEWRAMFADKTRLAALSLSLSAIVIT